MFTKIAKGLEPNCERLPNVTVNGLEQLTEHIRSFMPKIITVIQQNGIVNPHEVIQSMMIDGITKGRV